MPDSVIDSLPTVVYRHVGGAVAQIELNRPERRNALSADLLRDFHVALDSLDADRDASVVLLSGRGPSFCAGFDLSPGSASTASTVSDPWADRGRLRGWIELGLRLWESPRPVIAVVHGHCLAGGNLFMLCSDVVFISEDCAVGWPRLPLGAGFFDGALAHVIGPRRAKELSLIVGSRISGAQAADWGYANFAVPADELGSAANAFAKRMAKAPRSVLEMRKAAINRAQSGLTFREALLAGVEWDAIAHADPSVDEMRRIVRERGMKEAIAAFEGTDESFTTFVENAR